MRPLMVGLCLALWPASGGAASPLCANEAFQQLLGPTRAVPGPSLAKMSVARTRFTEERVPVDAQARSTFERLERDTQATAYPGRALAWLILRMKAAPEEVAACLRARWGEPIVLEDGARTFFIWRDAQTGHRVVLGPAVDGSSLEWSRSQGVEAFAGPATSSHLGLPGLPQLGASKRSLSRFELGAPGRGVGHPLDPLDEWQGAVFPGLGAGRELLFVHERIVDERIVEVVVLGDGAPGELQALRQALEAKWGRPLTSAAQHARWTVGSAVVDWEVDEGGRFRLSFTPAAGPPAPHPR